MSERKSFAIVLYCLLSLLCVFLGLDFCFSHKMGVPSTQNLTQGDQVRLGSGRAASEAEVATCVSRDPQLDKDGRVRGNMSCQPTTVDGRNPAPVIQV